jgi:hypothetical protein
VGRVYISNVKPGGIQTYCAAEIGENITHLTHKTSSNTMQPDTMCTKIPGACLPWRLHFFFFSNVYYFWILCTKLAACHYSGALNSDMVPRFLKMYASWLKHLRVYKQTCQ